MSFSQTSRRLQKARGLVFFLDRQRGDRLELQAQVSDV